jgi:glutamate-1-semialdehyde 2,1-aminomutase
MSDKSIEAIQSSEEMFERARVSMPGGISHENRQAKPHPIYVDNAAGSRKWDVEGKEYVDYAMGSASLLLGHAHPDVVKALQEQAAKGTFYADCHPLEVEWAELVKDMVPSADQVRFVGSGTEATLLAIRLGRAYSGRPKIIRFEGHFHGWHDYVALGMTAPYDELSTLGVLPAAAEATVVCPPDADAVADALKADGEIGTIICEVSGANWGCVPLKEGFLAELRRLADEHEVVLIFDEVITGFRWSPGGVQAVSGVTPDLTTMAKIVTGGMPGGAVGGKEKVMGMLDPKNEQNVFHRGTFNGNPLVAAAAVAALKIVKTGEPQRHANGIAGKIRSGMQKVLDEHQVDGVAYGEASTFHVYLGKNSRDAVASCAAGELRGIPKDLVQSYQQGLRERGVDFMSYLGGVTSSAHTDEDVDKTLGAFEEVIQDLMQEGRIGRV